MVAAQELIEARDEVGAARDPQPSSSIFRVSSTLATSRTLTGLSFGGTDREVVQPRQADRDAFVAVVAEYARARISPAPSMSSATGVRRAEVAQVPRCGWDAVRSSQMPRRVDPPVRCYKYWGNNGEGTGNVSDEARDRGVSCEGRHH